MPGAQAAINAKPHSFLQHVASAGEGGDDQIGHLSTGDTVIPVEKTRNNPQAQQMLQQVFQALKLDPKRFVVGHRENRTNHRTGLRQFDAGDSDGGGGGAGGPGAGGGAPGGGDSGASGGGAGDPSGAGPPGPTGSETAGTPGSALTGHESTTAVEGGEIPGTPVGTLSEHDAMMGSMLGKPFAPDLGFLGNVLGNQVGKIASNPVSSAINLGVGMIPGFGIANSISGALNGPTVGSVATSLGRDAAAAIGAQGTGTTTGSGGTVGSGGGDAVLPVDQAAQDAEWLKRLGLAV